MKHNPKFSSLVYHVVIAGVFAYLIHITTLIDLPYAWIMALNTLLFTSFGFDKFSAMKRWRRTPESTYLIMALLGAFPGLFLGRKIFNHKTSKASFIIPMWFLFIGQILVSAFWLGDTDSILAKIVRDEPIKKCTKEEKCQ